MNRQIVHSSWFLGAMMMFQVVAFCSPSLQRQDVALYQEIGALITLSLIDASRVGDIPKMKILIDAGATPCARDDVFGEHALLNAAAFGQLAAVKYLIERGDAPVDIRSLKGDTALIAAIKKHHPEIVRYLIAKGADVNIKGSRGATPLGWSVRVCDSQIEKELRSHGGISSDLPEFIEVVCRQNLQKLKQMRDQVDQVDGYGRTALHYAVLNGQVESVKLLLELRAKINMSDEDGVTPLKIAQEYNLKEIIRILKAAGAKE